MKVLFGSDLHGNLSQFKELIDGAAAQGAGALVLCGGTLKPPFFISCSCGAQTCILAWRRF